MITPVDRLFEAHLTVSDLDASIAFYRDRVGLELAHMVSVRQAAFFWVGSRGSTMLGLWASGPRRRRRRPTLRSRPPECNRPSERCEPSDARLELAPRDAI